MARNPKAKNYRVLGYTTGVWTSAINAVNTYLVAHDDEQEIPDADLRALDPILADDRTWNALRDELKL